MRIIVEIPQRILRGLEERAKLSEKSLEEIILETLAEQVYPGDPETKEELHLKLSEKYLREAEELLSKGDLAQASEKGWGAAAQMVKAVAAKKGKELGSHGMLWEFVEELSRGMGDRELLTLWHVANSLHTNFYESWAPPEFVKKGLEDITRFIEKLKKQ